MFYAFITVSIGKAIVPVTTQMPRQLLERFAQVSPDRPSTLIIYSLITKS